MDINKEQYRIVPLHRRPDLMDACCMLLNSEWPRSKTARLKSLSDSCDKFPTCLVLINAEDRVLGHCKISLIPKLNHSCFIQSVIINRKYRYQGLGSRLLKGAEEYAVKKGISYMYLVTKGQEMFYLKNGYRACDPFQAYGIKDVLCSTASIARAKLKEKTPQCSGPPPPPMPKFKMPDFFDMDARTHMVKRL